MEFVEKLYDTAIAFFRSFFKTILWSLFLPKKLLTEFENKTYLNILNKKIYIAAVAIFYVSFLSIARGSSITEGVNTFENSSFVVKVILVVPFYLIFILIQNISSILFKKRNRSFYNTLSIYLACSYFFASIIIVLLSQILTWSGCNVNEFYFTIATFILFIIHVVLLSIALKNSSKREMYLFYLTPILSLLVILTFLYISALATSFYRTNIEEPELQVYSLKDGHSIKLKEVRQINKDTIVLMTKLALVNESKNKYIIDLHSFSLDVSSRKDEKYDFRLIIADSLIQGSIIILKPDDSYINIFQTTVSMDTYNRLKNYYDDYDYTKVRYECSAISKDYLGIFQKRMNFSAPYEYANR